MIDQHAAVHVPEHLLHQSLGLHDFKVRRVNAIDIAIELGTINVPHIVCDIIRVVEPWPVETVLAEMLQPS